LRRLVIIVLCIIAVPLGSAYGHGIGLDTIESVIIEGKRAKITVQITPTEFVEGSEKKIMFAVTDYESGQALKDATLSIAMYHEGNVVFHDKFFANNGKVIIDVIDRQSEEIEIMGTFDGSLGAWVGAENDVIKLSYPAFARGGLYHFEISVIGVEGRIIENPTTYVADITVMTRHHYQQNDKNEKSVDFGVVSYYDKITDFHYDPVQNAVTFEMPFDWAEKNLSHLQVVHIEVHFPKEFSDLFVPSYIGKANGIELFKSSLTIDDYSDEEERIIHFVLTQNHLRHLKQVQRADGIDNPQNLRFTLDVSSSVVFPIVALTKNEEIQVDLSWDPITIEPEKNTKFVFTFRDATTGEPIRNTSYDFVLIQDGNIIYKKTGNARIGGDFVDYTFGQSQTGQTSVRFENIGPNKLSTEFGIMVVPEFGPLAFAILATSIIIMLAATKTPVFSVRIR
jgi:hypothetical protein